MCVGDSSQYLRRKSAQIAWCSPSVMAYIIDSVILWDGLYHRVGSCDMRLLRHVVLQIILLSKGVSTAADTIPPCREIERERNDWMDVIWNYIML